MIAWLLLLAAAPAAEPAEDPMSALKGTVVAAIRNCGAKPDGEIVACSPDRGFAEGERRITKLKKPKPVGSGAGVKVQVTAGTRADGPERE